MKVEFIKAHNGYEAGHIEDTSDEAANYLIAVGVAVDVKEKKAKDEGKEKKEMSQGSEKKHISKP